MTSVLRFAIAALGVCFVVGAFAGDENAAVSEKAAPNKIIELIQSDNDSREYRYLRLPNQMQVLLISDPSTDKAAAALDVGVGSGDDPADRNGLAHFLEHMLFLGTEKFPQADDYQHFISQHGGHHNAYTSSQHTNYFFDIDAAQLEVSLDRFAQFFVAPLFTEAYVDRERHAVHSEYQSKIKNDYRRVLDVYRELVRPEHPMAKFSVGSLSTLADREEGKEGSKSSSVRDALLDFYQRHYSADNMTLVVLGREPLDTLQQWVAARFAAVENRGLVGQGLLKNKAEKALGASTFTSPFSADFLPAKVLVKPVKEQRRLSLTFPLPPVKAYYREKPLQYLGNILGHEGGGSLLSVLKSQGWAEGLSAGEGLGSRLDTSFNINIHLTEAGEKAQDKIVALVFYVVEQLSAKGVESWRFEEQKKLADIAFRFQEKGEAIHTVSGLANNLHDYDAEDVLRGAYWYQNFDEMRIRHYLAYINPRNVLIRLSSPSVQTNRVSRLYQTPYAVESLAGKKYDTVADDLRQQLAFPQPNPFIPQRLNVAHNHLAANDDNEAPELLLNKERVQAWYQQDKEFSVPREMVNIRLKLPQVAESVTGAAQAHLLAALLNDALNEYAYPAALAGLGFSIEANSRGMDISVAGYSDRLSLLLMRIVDVIKQPLLSEDRFASLKAELIRHWGNAEQRAPYVRLLRDLPVMLYQPYWSDEQLIAALSDQSLKSLQTFAKRFLNDSALSILLYGNLSPQEALQQATIIERRLLGKELGSTLREAEVVKLLSVKQEPSVGKSGSSADKQKPSAEAVNVEKSDLYVLPVDHSDHAAVLYVQGLEDSLRDKAHMMMLRQVLRTPFFSELRTEKQLGYVVFVSAMPIKKVPGTVLLVQSPIMDAMGLIGEMNTFLEDFELPTELDQHRQAVTLQLLEQAKNLNAQGDQYWESILLEYPQFDYRQRLVAEIEKVSSASLSRYYQDVMHQSSRRLWLVAEPQASKGATPVSVEREGFTLIRTVDDYPLHKKSYRYP